MQQNYQKLISEKDELRKIVKKADQVFRHIYKGTFEITRLVKQSFNALLQKKGFEFKSSLTSSINAKLPKVKETAYFLENNEYLKKHKWFRKINEKIDLVAKIDCESLQQKYDKLLTGEGQELVQNIGDQEETGKDGYTINPNQTWASNSNSQIISDNDPEVLDLKLDFELFEPVQTVQDMVKTEHVCLEKSASQLLNLLANNNLRNLNENEQSEFFVKLEQIIGKLKRNSQRTIRKFICGIPKCNPISETFSKSRNAFFSRLEILYFDSKIHRTNDLQVKKDDFRVESNGPCYPKPVR